MENLRNFKSILRSFIVLAILSSSMCAPWTSRDHYDLQNNIEDYLLERLLDHRKSINVDNFYPIEEFEFPDRLKRNYAKPAIRVG
ncbi:unnamed protein product [Hymenolepis diminuta]|uniref:Uncharacterized protein n=1 Tax=Hymenolepis diminuta TaxID=6216 RepID=A0A564ZFA0_HYMDI|nr:unnamed protein product [Hymenolepis diminuta]